MSVISTAVASVKAFLKSPNNETAVVAFLSTVPGIAMQFADHSIGISALVSLASFGIVKIIVPDNTVLAQDIDKLIADGIAAYAAKSAASVSVVLGDGAKVLADIAAPSPILALSPGATLTGPLTITAVAK